MLCVVIPIYFMYRILNFYVSVFLKFIVHEINSKMVKFRMVVLTGREKANMTDANVVVG
jgi:hypothetical protein